MNLSVSNIAWPAELDATAMALLSQAGISALEIAPTRIWPNWAGASAASAGEVARQLALQGFRVSSLQAILFGKPECRLLGSEEDRQELFQHLSLCADLATAFGATSLVFGAPKNRGLCGRTEADAFQIAGDFFRRVGSLFAARGLHLCLEANPPEYGCEFITDSSQAARLVRAVDSAGFRLHLDTGCMQMSHEDPIRAIDVNFDIVPHFHVSEPFLASLEAATVDHEGVASALRKIGYDRWVTLEMRAAEQPMAALTASLDVFTNSYAPVTDNRNAYIRSHQ